MRGENEFSRKQFLQALGVYFSGLGLLSIPIEPDYESETVESKHAYIAQKTENSCSYAVMAMMISDNTNECVEDVYKRIVLYYKMIGKFDISLSASGLVDYMKRDKMDVIEASLKSRWNEEDIQRQVDKYGSTIICVSSNYGEVTPGRNYANHWIIFDKMVRLNGIDYASVRDPLRSDDINKPLEKLKSYMKLGEYGSIYIPSDILLSASGENYVYLKDGVGINGRSSI